MSNGDYTLYIGNRNYSSWSLRGWLMLRAFDIPFSEKLVALGEAGRPAKHEAYSDNGLVPCLHDGDLRVWDSLAIGEYLAERHPGLWPRDERARARARSISAEMHSGFQALRSAYSMNMRMRLKGRPAEGALAKDIGRIQAIWTQAREEFGEAAKGSDAGPFLFGRFSIADAMYAPVVSRFTSYSVALEPVPRAYADSVLAHPAMREWSAAARSEVHIRHYDEVAIRDFGPEIGG